MGLMKMLGSISGMLRVTEFLDVCYSSWGTNPRREARVERVGGKQEADAGVEARRGQS